jgi:lipoate synthase
MNRSTPSKLDIALAKVCENCPVCLTARKNQAGAAFQLVKTVETRACPFCMAYERVHGKKAHEPRMSV